MGKNSSSGAGHRERAGAVGQSPCPGHGQVSNFRLTTDGLGVDNRYLVLIPIAVFAPWLTALLLRRWRWSGVNLIVVAVVIAVTHSVSPVLRLRSR
jgi:hypothetical protein